MQSEFEKYLKNSGHFSDVINTHRAATAEVIGALMLFLVKNNHVSDPALREFLKGLEHSGGPPSIAGERGNLIARIGDYLKTQG